jgi:hypothetical protein
VPTPPSPWLVTGPVLGSVAGGAGALFVSRLLRSDDVQARLEAVEARLTAVGGEARTVLDETRSHLRESRAAAGRGGAALTS